MVHLDGNANAVSEVGIKNLHKGFPCIAADDRWQDSAARGSILAQKSFSTMPLH